MKKCPYCAEEIQDEAIVCRYCGKDIRVPVPPPASAPTALPERWNAAGHGFVKCPNCGLWQEDVRLWCEKCKAPLKEGAPRGPSVTASEPPEAINCPFCHKPMPERSLACPHCGRAVAPSSLFLPPSKAPLAAAVEPPTLSSPAPSLPPQPPPAREGRRPAPVAALWVEGIVGLFGIYGVGHLIARRWASGLALLLLSWPWLWAESVTKYALWGSDYPPGIVALAFHVPVMLVSVSILRWGDGKSLAKDFGGAIGAAVLVFVALISVLALAFPPMLSIMDAFVRRTAAELGNTPWQVGSTFPSYPCTCPRLTDGIYEAAADGETICVTGPATRPVIRHASAIDSIILTGSTLLTSYEVYGQGVRSLGEGDMIAVIGQVKARPRTLNLLMIAVGSGYGLFRCP